MKKEWLLILVSGVATLVACLLVIRWMAPGLLGVPVDLQLVQVDEKVPPFFENLFREEDRNSTEYLLSDPVIKHRAKPFYNDTGVMGPNDMLGFRNLTIPTVADIVVVGDSQTYGNNVPHNWTWPSVASKALSNSKRNVSLYNMSTGGWGAIQYYAMLKNAILFRPRVIVVAFYTGNDPLESFSVAYGMELYKEFRVDKSLSLNDAPPAVVYPPPLEERWPVLFKDGVKAVFTPTSRLPSNSGDPVIQAGYEIMAKVSEEIIKRSLSEGVPVFFTIIPTKELVYAPKVRRDGLRTPREYDLLVRNERQNISFLHNKIRSMPGARYIDVVRPLQEAAMKPVGLYPEDLDGHPYKEGYRIIGAAVADKIMEFIPSPPYGLFYGNNVMGFPMQLWLAKENRFWGVLSKNIAKKNGWDVQKDFPVYSSRDLFGYEYMGVLERVNPSLYGPTSKE